MTAIVGTLNRRGIAFAADSAATHTTTSCNGDVTSKITNNTNKIFQLRRKYPVGIAIYNNLVFHGIPWETIIKCYRDANINSAGKDRLQDYVSDFNDFLITKILPQVGEDQKDNVVIMTNRLLAETSDTVTEKLKNEGKEDNSPNFFRESEAFLNKLANDYKLHERASGFEGYTKEHLLAYAGDVIKECLKDVLSNKDCPKTFIDSFEDALFEIMMSPRVVYLSQTGLVFWGFGENEMFPSYYQYEISLAIDGRVKFVKLNSYETSKVNSACVVPFAQTDVANTVVRGIDQKLRDTINIGIHSSFCSFRNTIVEVLKTNGAPEELSDALLAMDVDTSAEAFIGDINKFIQANYIDKLMETVAYLSKEDLAEMAESLVKMTCLKRHITTDEESVGGPVDVAVITKGDGFIWIKRKHYFSAELNHQYFEH